MKLTNNYSRALEDRAESVLISLFENLDKLFEGTDEYLEKKERMAEKMIIGVVNYLDKLLDDDKWQADSA